MGVYIDREQAIKCLDGSVLITRQSEAEAVREYFEMVIKRLENLPTIDLVKCGECTEWHEYARQNLGRNLGRCDCWFITTGDDDFCSYGEREDE